MIRKKFIINISLLFIFLACVGPRAHGAIYSGEKFKDYYIEDGIVFALQGMGEEHFLLIKVFVAGFYLQKNVIVQNPLDDVAKKIEVSYLQKIPAKKLARETRERMKMNMTKDAFVKIEERVDIMDDYFVDIIPGDRFTLSYIPGMGTKFIYNNEQIGLIQGADFAKGLFSVWVGFKPIDQKLKDKLLGRE